MNADSHSNIGQETELKLAICSDSPQSLCEEIGQLKSIAGYDLSVQRSIRLRDRYLDTTDGAFSNRRWAIRIRTIGSNHYIAMKGPAVTNKYGILDRPEIEGKWSRDMLNEIAEQALEIGIELPSSDTTFNEHEPLSILTELGLSIVQDRETIRQIRLIAGQKGDGAVEMALDHVKYQVQEHTINHFEIELESMSCSGEKIILSISQRLLGLYGNDLRKWSYNKFVLGWAIDKLLGQPDALDLVHNGCLTPFAYDQIATMLSQLTTQMCFNS